MSQQDIRPSREDLERQILDLIISEGKIDPARIVPGATIKSLEVESMDIVLILMSIEERFDVYIPVNGQIAEAKDLTSFVRSIADQIQGTNA